MQGEEIRYWPQREATGKGSIQAQCKRIRIRKRGIMSCKAYTTKRGKTAGAGWATDDKRKTT